MAALSPSSYNSIQSLLLAKSLSATTRLQHPLTGALLVFLGAVTAGLAFRLLVPFSENAVTDYEAFYGPLARNLLAGKGLTIDGSQLALRYPPGYPLILAGVFKIAEMFSVSSWLALLLFTLLCYGLAAVLLFTLARNIWNQSTAFLVTAVWLSYPPLLSLTAGPYSELPFLILFYLSIYLFCYPMWMQAKAWPWLLGAGVCGGCAALIRPIGLWIGLALVVTVWLAYYGKSFRLRTSLCLAITLGNLIAILPWQSYVYLKTERVILLSTALVPGVRDGLRFAVNPKGYRQQIKVPADVKALTERIHARYDEMDTFSQVLAVVKDEARHQPLALLKLIVIKAARSWYATDSGKRESVILFIQLIYLGLTLWGLRGAWRIGGKQRQMLILIAGLVLAFWVMTMLVLSILRYMTPVIGLLFLFVPGIWAKAEGNKQCQPSA